MQKHISFFNACKKQLWILKYRLSCMFSLSKTKHFQNEKRKKKNMRVSHSHAFTRQLKLAFSFFFFFSVQSSCFMFFVGAVSFVLIFWQFSSSFPLLQSMTPSHRFELDMQTPGVHSNWSSPQAARIVYIRSDRMKKLSQGLFLSFLSSQFPSSNG